jgi:hypothetical protein
LGTLTLRNVRAGSGRASRASAREAAAQVPSFVDPGHHEIGQPPEDLGDRDVDAVGRRAIDAVDARLDVLEPQRTP